MLEKHTVITISLHKHNIKIENEDNEGNTERSYTYIMQPTDIKPSRNLIKKRRVAASIQDSIICFGFVRGVKFLFKMACAATKPA